MISNFLKPTRSTSNLAHWTVGLAIGRWSPRSAAMCASKAGMPRAVLARSMNSPSSSADWRVLSGNLDAIQSLRKDGIHCTSEGADRAAGGGELKVVQDLRAHGIHCTSQGADEAAAEGKLEVVVDLRAHGIHCTAQGADNAAANGYLKMIRDLRAHGIHCTSEGADWLAEESHLDALEALQGHGIYCTSVGADGLALNGHLKAIQELRAQNVHCTSKGADRAAKHGHVDVVRDLRAHGIYYSCAGMAAALLSKNRAIAEDARKHAHLAIKPEYLVQSDPPSINAPPASELPRLRVAMDVDGTLMSYIRRLQLSKSELVERVASLGLEHTVHPDTGDCDVLRPHAREFLQELATFADIVFYTNRVKWLADHSRNLLDPNNTIIKDVFCRDHAQTIAGDTVVKDLYFVAPSLSRVVLVDDEWARGGRLQLTSCLPAAHWRIRCYSAYDDEESDAKAAHDDHLMQVTLPMLRKLAAVPDVRPVLAAHIASQEHVLERTRCSWNGAKDNSMESTIRDRVKMLQKFGCGLNAEAIQDIADTTTEYAMYCLNMIEECAAQGAKR